MEIRFSVQENRGEEKKERRGNRLGMIANDVRLVRQCYELLNK